MSQLRSLRRASAALVSLYVLGASASGADVALSALASEAEALEAVRSPDFALPSVAAPEIERLVKMGWHDVVREYVLLSHAAGEADSQRTASQVRSAVQAAKNRLDDLIRVLDRNYGKTAEVTPASQWAQNSTHAFLAVKFAQRWNAPGALEVENETVSITDCCFNFTAFGEHSFIRRRYHLSFELFRDVASKASSWSWAAAGRMTVVFTKKEAASWPRLLKGKTAPKNLGVWRDMKEQWDKELKKFNSAGKKKSAPKKEPEPAPAPAKAEALVKPSTKGKSRRKRKAEDDDADDDEALDREVELVSDCPKSTYSGTAVAELCVKTWDDVVRNPRVKGRRWLVEFYSSQGDGNPKVMKTLMPVWRRLADMLPSMVPRGRVGAVDCGADREFCRQVGVASVKLPQVWRFTSGGLGEPYSGSLSDATMEDFAAFGGEAATGASEHAAEL